MGKMGDVSTPLSGNSEQLVSMCETVFLALCHSGYWERWMTNPAAAGIPGMFVVIQLFHKQVTK